MTQDSTTEPPDPKTFFDFWPIYLVEHSQPATRWWHFGGTTAALLVILGAFVTSQPSLVLLAPLLGYGGAWLGHLLVEKNRPATFTWPLWSLMGDLKMFGLMVRGKLWFETLPTKARG
jgi:hypothetical protein